MTGQHAARGRVARACRRAGAELTAPGPPLWSFVIWLQVSLWLGVVHAGIVRMLATAAVTAAVTTAIRALLIFWPATRHGQIVTPERTHPQ